MTSGQLFLRLSLIKKYLILPDSMTKRKVLNGKVHHLPSDRDNSDFAQQHPINELDVTESDESEDWGDEFTDGSPSSIKDDPIELPEEEPSNMASVEAAIADLFSDNDIDVQSTPTLATIHKHLGSALNAEDSEEYFELFGEAIADILRTADPEQHRWVQRLIKVPQSEAELLQRAIALHSKTQDEAMLPILAGLVARVAIAPRLRQIQKAISPTFQSQLLQAAQDLVNASVESSREEQLSKLVQKLGQAIVRRRVAMKDIPQLMQQSAQRMMDQADAFETDTSTPQPEQAISDAAMSSASTTKSPFSILAIGPNGEATQLKITGPAEIIIRLLSKD